MIIVAGIILLGGCSSKPAAVVPTAEQQVKFDPDAIFAAEKIAGYSHPEALISVYVLNEKMFESGIVVFDTRGKTQKLFQKTYPLGHIPGAVPFIYSNFYNENYPGRLASPLLLQDLLGNSGAGSNNCIVLYGIDGLDTRLYWAIKMYGYDNVKVLDGGLDKWKESGYELSTAKSKRSPSVFQFDLSNSRAEQMLATLKEVKAAVGNSNYVLIDARGDLEFSKGHIPGSLNIPWAQVLNKDMTFKSVPYLKEIFTSKGITQDKKIIVYSNAGHRSSQVWFALSELLGYPDVKNYDGSLNEWTKNGLPIVTGQK